MPQRPAHGGQVARGGAQVYHAAEQALDVGHLDQDVSQLLPRLAVFGQEGGEGLARKYLAHIAERLQDPAAQQARAHGGFTEVQHAPEGLGIVPVGRGYQLQRFYSGFVQLQAVRGLVIRGGEHLFEAGLGLAHIIGNVQGGLQGQLMVLPHGLRRPGRQALSARMRRGRPGRAVLGKRHGTEVEAALFYFFHRPGIGQYFSGACFRDKREKLIQVRVVKVLRGQKIAGGSVEGGQPPAHDIELEGDQIPRGTGLQQFVLDHGARGDKPHYFALEQLCFFCVPARRHLLADGHLVPGGKKPVDIVGRRVVRHAAHGHALPGGKSEAERRAGGLRVLVEHLVEIAQAEKKQSVGIGAFQRLVLLHQRRFWGFYLGHKIRGAAARTGRRRPRYLVYCIKRASASLRVFRRMKALRAPAAPGKPFSQ